MVMVVRCSGKKLYKTKKNTGRESRIRWWKIMGNEQKDFLKKMKERVV